MFFRLIGRVPAPAATSKTRNARLRVGSVSAWRISKEQQIKEPPQTADKLLPHPAARPPRAGRAAGPAVPSLARLRHRPSAATIAIARHRCRCRFRCRDHLAALPPTQWSATAWHNERGNALIRATHLVDGSCLTRLRRVHSRRPQLSKKVWSPWSDTTFLLQNAHRNTGSGRNARWELLGARCTYRAAPKCYARRAPRPSRPRRSRWCHRRPLARSASPRTCRAKRRQGATSHCHEVGWDRKKSRCIGIIYTNHYFILVGPIY